MPKIRELAITVLPEGFAPVEIGAGGCGWTRGQVCTDCTFQPFSICGGTQQTQCGLTMQQCAQWSGCSDCTVQPFSLCGGTQQTQCGLTMQQCAQGSGCSDCTVQPFSICGGT